MYGGDVIIIFVVIGVGVDLDELEVIILCKDNFIEEFKDVDLKEFVK